nr:HNH endonuclease family protein [Limnoglobus roseus]
MNTTSLKSAHRLFNVLNARGIPLSNADLIKNALFGLVGADPNPSEELESHWLDLEDRVGIERMDAFLGHHRTSVTAVRARGSLHEEYAALIEKAERGAIAFLERLVESAENYTRIVESDFDGAVALRSLQALHRVEYDEWIPPLLAYLNEPIDGMPEAEFVGLLERITMQNWVRRLGQAARLTAYYHLINAIRGKASADEVREVFRRNAQNDEFLALLGGEVYGKPFDAAVLLRLEEAAQDESVTRSYSGRLTIEHVMPQAFKDPYWVGRYTLEQHAHWLHRLGNLAMLCGHKNYKAQYYDFPRKKKIYADRDKKVSFDLTKEVCAAAEWTPEAIQSRQERLLELARRTWTIE